MTRPSGSRGPRTLQGIVFRSALFLGLFVTSCSRAGEVSTARPVGEGPLGQPSAADAGRRGPPSAPAISAPAPWSVRTLSGLTLREKIAQMMMPIMLGDFAPEGSRSHDRILRLVEEEQVGGIIMSMGSPTEIAVKINDMQGHARVPLLVAADLETGAGYRMSGLVQLPSNIVLGGATNFPPLMAVGATGEVRYAYEMGRVTAQEARAVGIHVPFAPVLDVNNNPENPVINTRSFGEDPEAVSLLGAAFVRGIQEHGGMATGKHFPGHGDTELDSHLALPLIDLDRARLESVELAPFQRAIDAGIGGIMTAHIIVPSLSGDERTPATLSHAVLTEELRDRMGFDGLIFTDAMDMAAIDREFGRAEAAVMAVEAGADVLLMPPDVGQAVDAIAAAVRSGRILERRIDESVARLLALKEELKLDLEREVRIEGVMQAVGLPENLELAQEIADHSVTLLRNDRNLLPLRGTRSARVLSVSYRRSSDLLAGRYFNRRMRSTYPRLTTAFVDRDSPRGAYSGILEQAQRSNLVVVSLYINTRSAAGEIVVPEEMTALVSRLAEGRIPHVVVSFGNPYLIAEVPDAQAYVLGWSGAAVTQRAVAKALFGEIAIRGRSPISIPPFFGLQAGIAVPAKVQSGDGSR